MSFFKKLADGIRNPVKKITSPVTSVVQKVTAKGPLKTVKLAARKVAAVAAPFTTGGVGLVVQPKVLGIKNASSAKLFDRSQQVTRIVGAVAAGVVAAPIVGPVLASAGSAIGTGLSTMGGGLATFGKQGLAMLTPGTEDRSDVAREEKLGMTMGASMGYLSALAKAKAARDNPAATGTLSMPSGLPPWLLPVGAAVAVVAFLAVRK